MYREENDANLEIASACLTLLFAINTAGGICVFSVWKSLFFTLIYQMTIFFASKNEASLRTTHNEI